MKSVDWTARADQLDAAVVQLVQVIPNAQSLKVMSLTSRQAQAPILEAFCNGAKAEVGLLNAVQVYCYTDTRVMKAFAAIVKVLYNADVVSDQAIIYWHQKGAKPQGKQHFLKATEALVNVSATEYCCQGLCTDHGLRSSWRKSPTMRNRWVHITNVVQYKYCLLVPMVKARHEQMHHGQPHFWCPCSSTTQGPSQPACTDSI